MAEVEQRKVTVVERTEAQKIWFPWTCKNCEELKRERVSGHSKETLLGKTRLPSFSTLIKSAESITVRVRKKFTEIEQPCRKCGGKQILHIEVPVIDPEDMKNVRFPA